MCVHVRVRVVCVCACAQVGWPQTLGRAGAKCANWSREQEAADLFSFVHLNMKLVALSWPLRSPVAFDFEMTSVGRLGSEVRQWNNSCRGRGEALCRQSTHLLFRTQRASKSSSAASFLPRRFIGTNVRQCCSTDGQPDLSTGGGSNVKARSAGCLQHL